MKRSLIPALLLLTTGVLSSCYTQLASDSNEYTARRRAPQPYRTDTLIVEEHPGQPQVAAAQPKVEYDTVMKGDTMFITERTREDYTQNVTQPNASANATETIINNYYGGYEPYDYWAPIRPRPVFSIVIGYPYWGYHSWYSPWYPYGYYPSWYYGPFYSDYYYPGFYPPLYDAYSPFYGGYYNPYYGYGGRYGGYGYHHYGHVLGGRVPHYGRIMSGEHRAGEASGPGVVPHSFVQVRRPAGVNSNQGQTGLAAREEPTNVANRNAPVHVVEPGTGGAVTSTPMRDVPVVIHRNPSSPAPSSTTTPNAATVNGHRVVIVRRSAPGGYRSSDRPNRSGGIYRSGGGSRSAPSTTSTPRSDVPRSSTGNAGARPSGGEPRSNEGARSNSGGQGGGGSTGGGGGTPRPPSSGRDRSR